MVNGTCTIRVSVAMVTYNGASYLRQQLDSILPQLGEQDELVISDDGSKDGTCSILQEYQDREAKIRILQGPRQGVKKNVQYVLQNVRGRYIFLSDQDDIWLPEKLKRVLQEFQDQQVSIVIHDAKVCAGEDCSTTLMGSFFAFRGAGAGVLKNMIKNTYIGCCMAFRRELLEIVCPIPNQIEMHDQWIGILGDYFVGKSCFLKEPLLLYRRHEENQSAMTHYGIGKMLRNRLVFFFFFWTRVFCIYRKRVCTLFRFRKKTVDK